MLLLTFSLTHTAKTNFSGNVVVVVVAKLNFPPSFHFYSYTIRMWLLVRTLGL